jgi:hypothetical protein
LQWQSLQVFLRTIPQDQGKWIDETHSRSAFIYDESLLTLRLAATIKMSDAQPQTQTQEASSQQQVQGQQARQTAVNPYQQYQNIPRAEGYRPAAIRESRIKDRPQKNMGNDSLSIKIELDLEVEVDLYARVKGDITIVSTIKSIPGFVLCILEQKRNVY